MRLLRPKSDDGGAIAVLTALLMVVVLAIAALGVDIATQVNERQKLHDTIDAAAHAGAYRLPGSGTQAKTDALAYAASNDPTAPVPTVDFFCVVASKWSGSAWVVDTSQIPATCNPLSERVGGTAPTYLNATYPRARCNFLPGSPNLPGICAIPCNGANDVCNTVQVTGTKPVPFSFAPAVGITQPGSTGSVSSAACKGSCGTTAPNPMDVAVVADRTLSMRDADINEMISGIKGMLQKMTPSQQYVALGTIGRSKLNPGATTCTGNPLGSNKKARSEEATPDTTMRDGYPQKPSINHETIATGGGPWMPEAFSNNYLLTDGTTNPNSTLINAVECLRNKNSYTHLAAPMKAAARLLLGKSPAPGETPNNVASLLPARTTTPTPQKVLIFETDGVPYESGPTGGFPDLNNSADIYSNNMRTMSVGTGGATRYYFNGGHEACQNLVKQAAVAKAAGILVITIAYNLSGQNCDSSDHTYLTPSTQDGTTAAKAWDYSRTYTPSLVLNILAAAAQEKSPGVASAANSDCSSTGERNTENTDGDYFFCAASGDDMASIFETAFEQVATGIRLIKLP